jgi:hypothetical protein
MAHATMAQAKVDSDSVFAIVYPASFDANIAQLVEQRIRNAQVVGSIPTVGSMRCLVTSPA